MLCTIKRKVVALVFSGLTTATFGLVLFLMFPAIIQNQIKKRLILREGSESYQYWKENPVPIYIEFYFFNVTNPEEVYNLTSRPVLEQLGPYTFRESREKINITWNNENGTVTYRQIKKWYYQPDRTNGSLDDNITTLNVPMVAAAAKGKEMNSDLVYLALDEIFSSLNCSWFVQKSASELLFEGYSDRLLKYAKTFADFPYDKFGWFYKRNGTDDGEFVVHTGENDIESLDEVDTWNGTQYVAAYDPPCNMINGSAGDMWPPSESRPDEITLFVTDICRSISFKYLKQTEIKNIKAHRFWADNTQLDNGEYNPENRCFCSGGVCLPAGAVNVSACKLDAPAVVSYPHFLFADSVYSQGVIGMRPNPQEHMMYLDLASEMGVPLSVAARMQINIIFDGISQISQFENITERIYFPILWFSETAEVSESIASEIRFVLGTLPLISNVISFIMVSIGCFLVLTALVLSILYAMEVRRTEYSAVSS